MHRIFGLSIVFALASGLAQATNGPVNCNIRTYNGRYLTAVGGGGRTSDAIHSDARVAKSWERFTLVDADQGTANITYGIRTVKGFYLTAVDGGGEITDVIHSDATRLRDWEFFQFVALGGSWYAIRTYNGRYLTAVDGGGRITDVIHSDARQIRNWEKFQVTCGVP